MLRCSRPRSSFHRGEFIEHDAAALSVQDRGVLFADGVYEVVRYDCGRAFAIQAHVERMTRSLGGIELAGVDAAAFAGWSEELMRRNGLRDAKVYWQATRGPAARDFVLPADADPTVTLIAYPMPPLDRAAPLEAGSAVVVEDCRWTRCWIKSLMLLPASLAKTRAKQAGAAEAIFERAKPGSDARHITEGASTNVFIVRGGVLQTHPDDGWILGGITRRTLLRLAEHLGIATDAEQAFTRQQLHGADEVFVCSTTQLTAITTVDGRPIGKGRPGPVTRRLHGAYRRAILHPDDVEI